ncbi:MAG: AmmeMemoRadiSam system protein A [Bacilli bacterium]|nr:AmmeMemoRadiSam system protein A [Bacilli bacterium]MBN2877318.1 AmmeMemoRadiSam system protein A [Bacilli bacterium]
MPIIGRFIVPHPPLIIPDIGRGEETKIQDTIDAYNTVAKKIQELHPDTIIISSPHSTMYSDYFHISPGNKAKGDLGRFRAKQVSFDVRYNESLRNKIISACEKQNIRCGTLGEKDPNLDHGTMIPLYFVNQYYQDFNLIRISPSGMTPLEHYQLGKTIRDTIASDLRVVWIASGDLSHKLKEDGPYGLAAEGLEFDKTLCEIIRSTEFNHLFDLDSNVCYKAAECGLGSICMMVGTLDGYGVDSTLLSYQNTFGVGYMVAMFNQTEELEDRRFLDVESRKRQRQIDQVRMLEDEYVSLARKSLEYYLSHHQQMRIPNDLSLELLQNKAGVFVSLHKNGNLRGCVGTISATSDSIAEEIIQNAISAGTKDYRFQAVRINELSQIDYSVDVLMPSEPITSKDKLDVKRYGLIVRHKYKSGLLLPNIDGVESVEEQIRIAKRKAGISEDEPFTMERFEVIRHH